MLRFMDTGDKDIRKGDARYGNDAVVESCPCSAGTQRRFWHFSGSKIHVQFTFFVHVFAWLGMRWDWNSNVRWCNLCICDVCMWVWFVNSTQCPRLKESPFAVQYTLQRTATHATAHTVTDAATHSTPEARRKPLCRAIHAAKQWKIRYNTPCNTATHSTPTLKERPVLTMCCRVLQFVRVYCSVWCKVLEKPMLGSAARDRIHNATWPIHMPTHSSATWLIHSAHLTNSYTRSKEPYTYS